MEIDKYWNDFIYTICEGRAGEMNEIIKMDIFSFFAYVLNYQKGLKKK